MRSTREVRPRCLALLPRKRGRSQNSRSRVQLPTHIHIMPLKVLQLQSDATDAVSDISPPTDL